MARSRVRHRPGGRRRADPVPLRRLRRLLRALARPAPGLFVRLLPRRRRCRSPQAQEAKLEHICSKLMLKEGERFLDIGAGWGGLLLCAAEHYGVRAPGHHAEQEPARPRQPADRRARPGRPGAHGPARLPRPRRERAVRQDRLGRHVRARRPGPPARVLRQDPPPAQAGRPAAEPRHHRRRHAQPPARRRASATSSSATSSRAASWCTSRTCSRRPPTPGLEAVDVESLRPHYAKTLWAWSDALEAQLGTRAHADHRHRAARLPALPRRQRDVLRARLALAAPDALRAAAPATSSDGPMRGAQSAFPFNRGYMYPQR